MKITMAEKLKDLRVGKGMTLKQAAEKAGLSASTISNYEDTENPRTPTAESLCKLLEVYGVTVDEFFGIEGADYEKDLKTFQRYGFSEKFFKEFVFLEQYNDHQIAECLNRLFEPPLFKLTFFENLSKALDPANYKKLVSQFPEFTHEASMRFLLEPVVQSLILMLEEQYSQFKP